MSVRGWFTQLSPSRRRLAWFGGSLIAACMTTGGLTIWQWVDVTLSVRAVDLQLNGPLLWISVSTLVVIGSLALMLKTLLEEFRRFEASQAALRISERTLAEKSELLETTLEHMDQGLLMVTPGGIVGVCNRRAIELLDLPVALMRSKPAFEAVVAYQNDRQEFANLSAEMHPHVFRGLPKTLVHHERQRPNGTVLEMTSVPLAGGGMVRTFKDITARRMGEDQVKHLAFYDDLTQLFNRAMILQRLQEAIAEANKAKTGLAVLYLDLDRFKQVNDTRGHAAGDALLVEVAARIRAELRDGDTVGRLGGDEFAIVCPGIANAAQARRSAHRVAAAIRVPYLLDGEASRIDVTIGVAMFPTDGDTAEALLSRADNALYRAKASGRSTVTCYETSMVKVDTLEQDMQSALELDQFEMAYQPIFDVKSGSVVAFEALLQWRHPSRGLVPYADFMLDAERSGIIDKLGRWMMHTACAEAATWAMPVRVAINLSPAQFSHGDLESLVVETLHRTGLSAERLTLELTEAVRLEDQELVLETMLALRTLGVGLVLEEFHSADPIVGFLRELPFQQIKIARSSVASMLAEPSAMEAVRAALEMARTMRLEASADGVEEQAELDVLKRLGCGQAQGGLLGRPQTPEWTREYLWQATRRSDALVAAGE